MAIRPTAGWREGIEAEARLVASGELEPEWAVYAELFPPALLQKTDQVLETFEADVRGLGVAADDAAVLAVVQSVVLRLNEVHEAFDHDAYATDERDRLCVYIDQVLSEHGVDPDALAERQGFSPLGITDEWRTW